MSRIEERGVVVTGRSDYYDAIMVIMATVSQRFPRSVYPAPISGHNHKLFSRFDPLESPVESLTPSGYNAISLAAIFGDLLLWLSLKITTYRLFLVT